MRATGVIRKIDKLGRIVIPNEIKKYIGIQNGDLFEILVEEDRIILKKYEPSICLKELVTRLEIEFVKEKNNMNLETANEISIHIKALQEILNV